MEEAAKSLVPSTVRNILRRQNAGADAFVMTHP